MIYSILISENFPSVPLQSICGRERGMQVPPPESATNIISTTVESSLFLNFIKIEPYSKYSFVSVFFL